MTTDIDVFRTAKLLMDQHGEDAAIHATIRADEMLDRGDMDGKAVWTSVVRAIEVLSAVEADRALQ